MTTTSTVVEDWEEFRKGSFPDAPKYILPALRGCFIAGAASGVRRAAFNGIQQTQLEILQAAENKDSKGETK